MRLPAFLLLFFASSVFAQESLYPLDYAPSSSSVKEKRNGHDSTEIIYLFDTLELPFIDDFVRNRNKNMRLSLQDAQVFDSSLALFRVNDSTPQSLPLLNDTNFSIFESSPGVIDTIPLPPLEVIFYDSLNNYTPIDTQYFWQVDREVILGATTYTEIFTPDTILTNDIKVRFYARDDLSSFWINEGAFRNNSFGVNPPTVGVMTFDGLDRLGVPYDFSSANTYGDADQLISKPINLGLKANNSPYTAQDSIFLSFYYQPQGLGNAPEISDSLSLNFYSPVTERWYYIWGVPGDTLQNFRRVSFHITDTLFLQKGFQFRFRNKATLSGSLDHWNIDYVAIAANARVLKQNFADVGYYGETPSYIKTFTSMPWLHFKRDPEKYMIPEIQIPIINLSNLDRFLQNRFSIRKQGDTGSIYTSPVVTTPNLPAKRNLSITIPIFNAAPSFVFPSDMNERAYFEVRNFIEVSPDENRSNDTLIHNQYFDTYYAYDDGVAELAYSLNGIGARLAYEFETDGTDTLKALLINFPQMLLNEQNRRINIMVWNDLSQEPIYQSGPVWEVSYPDLNDFRRFVIDQTVVVSGKYYIGWEQQDNRKIYVGWDVNKRNENRLFYSLDGSWTQTSFEGSLMLRPDFGVAKIHAATKEALEKTNQSIKLYPNPSRDRVFIETAFDYQRVLVYDLNGRAVLEKALFPGESFSVIGLNSGFYIVQLQSNDGRTTSTKLRVHND